MILIVTQRYSADKWWMMPIAIAMTRRVCPFQISAAKSCSSTCTQEAIHLSCSSGSAAESHSGQEVLVLCGPSSHAQDI